MSWGRMEHNWIGRAEREAVGLKFGKWERRDGRSGQRPSQCSMLWRWPVFSNLFLASLSDSLQQTSAWRMPLTYTQHPRSTTLRLKKKSSHTLASLCSVPAVSALMKKQAPLKRACCSSPNMHILPTPSSQPEVAALGMLPPSLIIIVALIGAVRTRQNVKDPTVSNN